MEALEAFQPALGAVMKHKDKDVSKVVRGALSRGWSYEQGRKHAKLTSPGGHLVSLSVSPSDCNAAHNVRRDVERIERMEGLR